MRYQQSRMQASWHGLPPIEAGLPTPHDGSGGDVHHAPPGRGPWMQGELHPDWEWEHFDALPQHSRPYPPGKGGPGACEP